MEKLNATPDVSGKRGRKVRVNTAWLLGLACLLVIASCKKENDSLEAGSSIKLISTSSSPNFVKLASGSNGRLLAYFTSEVLGDYAFQQELLILNQSGELVNKVSISDSTFQFMNAIPAVSGGFLVCASVNGSSDFSLFHVTDNGDVTWSKTIPLFTGTIINEPIITSYQNEYLVVYHSYSWGYYLWKGDANGTELLHKRIPIPNAKHYGSGLNYGEKYSRFIQGNDSLIIIQGITFDEYDKMIENCFLRTVDQDINKKWYSSNYDSTHIESSSGLFYSADNKILLFGSRSSDQLLDGFGEAFARTYTTTGVLDEEKVYPHVGGSLNVMKRTIQSPDGGYLMIGSNNQLPSDIVVSPNQLVLMKLNPDLSVSRTSIINTGLPCRGFEAAYLSDGSIGVVALLKDINSTNQLVYFHLDSSCNLVNN